jgi:hypothetical protein
LIVSLIVSLNNQNPMFIWFLVSPAQVMECPEWSQLKLPPVSSEILRKGWQATLSFVRELLRNDNVSVFDMRLMVVGASEVSAIVCVCSPSE